MTIREVYEKFGLPPNLQEHMLTVTKVVLCIKSYWSGPSVDWDNLVKAALLHDVGNIVRLKFDSNTEIYGEEVKRLEYWRKRQEEMAKKYGKDDHEATRIMLREINIDPKIIDWILSKSFADAVEIASSGSWEDKILLYSDMRVLPTGVGTLMERLNELSQRRKELVNDPDFKDRIGACQVLETQIQKHLSISVKTIVGKLVFGYGDNLIGVVV